MSHESLKMSRRHFTAIVSGLFATSAMSGCSVLNVGSGNAYSVPVLGDMHYDTFPMEKFHSIAIPIYQANPKRHSRLREFKRNAEMWTETGSRAVLKAAKKVVREDAAFALQVGDLIQGDCMDDPLHEKMLAEATALLDETYPNLPVVSVCGNHDIRDGKTDEGAAQAYANFFPKWESKQLGKKFAPKGVATTTFGFRAGKDLWIAMDFNFGPRDVEIVKKLLADNPDVRYTFIAVHGPVLPMDVWRCRWFYLGAPAYDAMRREMRALFAKRNAIVLSGHIHTVELRDWFGDGGRITEFVFNTVLSGSERPDEKRGDFPAEPWLFTEDPKDFGNWIAKGKKADYNDQDPKSKKCTFDMDKLYEEYRPGLKRLWVACCTGHFMLRVNDSGVWVDYYGRTATTPTKTFTLR